MSFLAPRYSGAVLPAILFLFRPANKDAASSSLEDASLSLAGLNNDFSGRLPRRDRRVVGQVG